MADRHHPLMMGWPLSKLTETGIMTMVIMIMRIMTNAIAMTEIMITVIKTATIAND